MSRLPFWIRESEQQGWTSLQDSLQSRPDNIATLSSCFLDETIMTPEILPIDQYDAQLEEKPGASVP